jgi:hypothetical protein
MRRRVALHAPPRPLSPSLASHSSSRAPLSQAAGVILVHDLTRRRGAAGLGAWASELATAASFAPGALAGGAGAAPPNALATHLRDLGLPVPVRACAARLPKRKTQALTRNAVALRQALVIGTKADVAERRRRSALGVWLSAAVSAATGPARRCLQGLRGAASRRGLGRPPRPSGTGALLPEYASRQEREAQLFATATLRSAAPLGCALSPEHACVLHRSVPALLSPGAWTCWQWMPSSERCWRRDNRCAYT